MQWTKYSNVLNIFGFSFMVGNITKLECIAPCINLPYLYSLMKINLFLKVIFKTTCRSNKARKTSTFAVRPSV